MLTEEQRYAVINAVKPDELANLLVDRLPDEAQLEIKGLHGEDTVGYAINSEYVVALAECLLEVVAYTVSTLIDAGSERDAVMENVALAGELELELAGWSEKEVLG